MILSLTLSRLPWPDLPAIAEYLASNLREHQRIEAATQEYTE